MLKALEYIQSLRQRTGTDSKLQAHHDTGSDDSENLRSMLRLASSPVQSNEPQQENSQEEEEDKSKELLQAVISTLQQTEKAAKPAPLHSKGEAVKPQVITPHKKLPLMFEDDEEEGDQEEDFDHRNPFKRTNENVEEKYTPQNLATLQSVFEELGKLTSPNPKQQNDKAEEGNEDLFNVRDVAYDDENWGPLQEREEEEEEEEEDNRHEVERALDYFDDNEDATENEKELDNDNFPIKRSQDPDDVANLADYYLLKVLEQTEEEEQKRALEEEEERTERRVVEYKNKIYKNNIDPRLIYQLLQLSQKYQIPPEDLIRMLRGGETTSQKNILQAPPIYTRKTYKKPQLYYRRLPEQQKTPEELRTERILKILGLSGEENNNQAPLRKQKQYKSSPSRFYTRPTWRLGESTHTQQRLPTKLKDEYDDTENQLAAYLAAQMLAKYPTYKSKQSQKRDEDNQAVTGSLEQAIQGYFDHLDTDRNEKKQFEDNERSADEQIQSFDNEAVMKLLSFVNPETDEAEHVAKTTPGIWIGYTQLYIYSIYCFGDGRKYFEKYSIQLTLV